MNELKKEFVKIAKEMNEEEIINLEKQIWFLIEEVEFKKRDGKINEVIRFCEKISNSFNEAIKK